MVHCDRNLKIQVVHISLQLDVGGMEKLLVEFARHADRDRFDLRFVSMTTHGRVADEIAALGWPVMALEAPSGVRPGVVRTEIHARSGDPARLERIAATAPLQRAGEPEEVARAILWMLSDEASYTTGTMLDVTGGR